MLWFRRDKQVPPSTGERDEPCDTLALKKLKIMLSVRKALAKAMHIIFDPFLCVIDARLLSDVVG